MQNTQVAQVKTPLVRILTVAEWEAEFQPLPNHLDKNAGFGGLMFETYGDEEKAVKVASPAHVWTYFADCDIDEAIAKEAGYELKPADYDPTVTDWFNSGGEPMQAGMVGEGMHFVNRMGYFITAVPAEEGVQYVIYDDDDLAQAAKIAQMLN